MEISQLQYFKTVARLMSFTQASKELHVTQSALSKSISKLEQELGLKLFEREGNSIHLNRFGQAFLEYTNTALMALEDGIRATREMAGLEKGEIHVATCQDVFIAHLTREFLMDYPHVSLYCHLQSPEQMVESLQDGSVDFAINTDMIVGSDITWTPLFKDRLTVLLGKCHRLAGREAIELGELAQERFVVSNMGYGMENATYMLCLSAGFKPKILYEGHDTDMPMSFVASGKAVMITPYSITMGVSQMIPKVEGILSIPLLQGGKKIEKVIGSAMKSSHFKSRAAMEFHERICNYYKNLS